MNQDNHNGHRWDQVLFSAVVLVVAALLGLAVGAITAAVWWTTKP